MKGYGIYVKNDLLEPKHIEAMSDGSIFLYLWLLDKMTSISEEGIGLVLGGKPIKQSEFEKETGIKKSTYNRYVKRLKYYGYISTTRTPFGLVFRVNKATKIFGNDVSKMKHQSKSDVSKMNHRCVKNETSDVSKMTLTKKTIQLDNTEDNTITTKVVTEFGNSDINEIMNYFKLKLELPSLDGTVKSNRYASKRLLTKANNNVSAVKKLIDCLALDDFHAENASSVVYLDKHAVAIMNRARRNNKIGVVK